MLAHREPGARLGVLRDRRYHLPGPQPGKEGESAAGRPGAVGLEQKAAQVLVDLDRRIAGGVDAAGDARLDLAEGDLVGDVDRRLETGPASLLDVVGRRLRRQRTAEDRLAGEVEVPAALEHGAGGDLAEPLPGEAEAGDEAVDGGGQHVLVRRLRVLAVAAGERDAVAAEDRGAASVRAAHADTSSPSSSRTNLTFGNSPPMSVMASALA